jgi:hypothetical protein
LGVRPHQSYRDREAHSDAERELGERGLRRPVKAHAHLVDSDETQRIGRHAAAQAFGDVIAAKAESRLRNRDDGSIPTDIPRAEDGRRIRLLANRF